MNIHSVSTLNIVLKRPEVNADSQKSIQFYGSQWNVCRISGKTKKAGKT